MRQQIDDNSRATMLKTVQQEFTIFRNTTGGRSPERLKQLAVEAVKQGATQLSVAKAAGVAAVTIREWMTRTQPRAKQLAIVEAAPQAIDQNRRSPDGVICIRLNSGIEIDVPRSELSCEMLTMLNNMGALR